MSSQNENQQKIILKSKRIVLISTGKFRFHYSFYLGKRLLHGNIDFRKNHFRILPLFVTILVACGILLFGINNTVAMIEPEFSVMENDLKDQQAKNADDKYLEDTEKQKLAIITAEEIKEEENSKKKLTLTKYKIQDGDTLSEIANRFGVPMDSIAGSSGISSSSIIKPGQELLIPNKKGIVYRLKKGDTLASVSTKYKVKIENVYEENKLANGDILSVGQKLFLPGAVIPETGNVWSIPVDSGVITSGYGWRRYPKRKFHDALDLKANYVPVKAARSGKIIYSGWMGGYGNTVIIQHTDSLKTLYAHNSRLYVKNGQYVSSGKVISQSGCTGFCFGPHLHFEVIKNGRTTNPAKYLKGLSHKR